MTIGEASENYGIPMEILQEYERWGLYTSVNKVVGKWQYDDADLERLSLIMTLHDIGFDRDEVENYMRLLLEGESTEGQRLGTLNQKRSTVLDEIHFKEAQLNRLDYLRYEIQTAMKKRESR